ncbi:site-specific integrase [Rhodococcus sp. ACPA1]|uniref:site-specific integrase n=1 Tax=Rhodococcus sp. ACPA1 TaxID=2028572 RepID=UPI00211C0CA4|nr:site-specific integrase [Rhodococcus sp. ACPA1]
MTRLPWIPTERQWADILTVAAEEHVRNRLMLTLAYDAALRREELRALRTDDLDPAHRTLRIRAETTTNRLEWVVPYSTPTGVLLSGYLRAGRDSAELADRCSCRSPAAISPAVAWRCVIRTAGPASALRVSLNTSSRTVMIDTYIDLNCG